MATQPMNVETTFNGAQSMGPVRGTILDQWLSAHEKWAPLTLRVPLGVIFFAHGAHQQYGSSGSARILL